MKLQRALLAAAVIFLGTIANAQKTVDAIVDLPAGITTKDLDLGPSGDVVVSPSTGTVDGFHVYLLRDSASFTTGAIAWQGALIGTLHCYEPKCVQLSAGKYQARFLVRNVDPQQIAEAITRAQKQDVLEVASSLMDRVDVTYLKTKNGKAKGKPLQASYFVEWDRMHLDLRDGFLAAQNR